MGCWCSTAKPPQQSNLGERAPLSLAAIAAGRPSNELGPAAAKSSSQLAEQRIFLALRSNRCLLCPNSNVDSGCSNARQLSTPTGGPTFANDSSRQQPSASCCQPGAIQSPDPGGSRFLRNNDFEDHALKDASTSVCDGELICGAVATMAVDITAGVAGRTVPTGVDSAPVDSVFDNESEGYLLKSSRALLQSVVPLLLNTSTAPSASVTDQTQDGLPPACAAAAAAMPLCFPTASSPPPRSAAATAAERPLQQPAAASESQAQHATAGGGGGGALMRRHTFIHGLTRDSFLLNNTTTGANTAYSGYMMRTATGRGELLLHADAAGWLPFHMGNPLQVQIGELLGRGGCGSVYRGQWRDRPVAVKVVQQVVAPPAGAGGAGGGGGSGAMPGVAAAAPPAITPLVDYFDESDGGIPQDDGKSKCPDGGGGRAPYLPDAHASVKRLRHPNVLRTYAYAVLSAAPQLDGVHPARHEHHVVLELCDGGTLRGWLDRLYNGSGGKGCCTAAPAMMEGVDARAALPHLQPPLPPPACGNGSGGAGDGGSGGPDLLEAAQIAAQKGLEVAQLHLVTEGGPVPQEGSDACRDTIVGLRQLQQQQQQQSREQEQQQQELRRSNQQDQGHQRRCEAQHGQHNLCCPPAQHPDPPPHQQQPRQEQQQHPLLFESPGRRTSSSERPDGDVPESTRAHVAIATPSVVSSPAGPHGGAAAAAAPFQAAAHRGTVVDAAPCVASSAATLPTPPRHYSDAGGTAAAAAAADVLEHSRSSHSTEEVLSRRLPGLTPAQSEQLQLLGMVWVSDSQEKLRARHLTLGGSARWLNGGGGGGRRRDDGSGCEGSWMPSGSGADGVAVTPMSGPSSATEGIGGGEGAAAGAARNVPLRRRRSPAASTEAEELAADWAETIPRAYGNVSVGSGGASTMVRRESSSCAIRHTVQQHCVVLDDKLDDDSEEDSCIDGGGGGDTVAGVGTIGVMFDGSSGGYFGGFGGGSAAFFRDLRLHGRLGLVEEESGEGRHSSRSRCGSAAATASSTAATTTPTNTTAVTTGVEGLSFRRQPTQASTHSSNGGIAAAAAAAAAIGPPLPLRPSVARTILAGSGTIEALLASQPSALGGHTAAVASAAGPDAAMGPSRPASTSPSAGTVDASTATAGEGSNLLRPPAQLSGKESSPLEQLAAVLPPPPSAPSVPRPLLLPSLVGAPPPTHPLKGEIDAGGAVTAMLNRRAVGMVNSILRAAGIASGSGGAAAAASVAEPPPPPLPPVESMQPAQLQHLVTALGCLVEIASGLSYLHGIGMVHGDVKSGNVLLKMDPRHPRGFVLKLADFGFSRVLEHGSHTYLSQPSGTLAYLSPEMVTAHRQSSAADQYAFGLLAWEVVTTQPLFRGLKTPQVLYAKTHNMDWQHLVWPPWCPLEVRALARRCADYHPAARLTAPEAREQLDALKLHYQGILSHSSSITSGDGDGGGGGAAEAGGP